MTIQLVYLIAGLKQNVRKVIHLDLKIKSSAIYVGTEFQSLMQFLCLV